MSLTMAPPRAERIRLAAGRALLSAALLLAGCATTTSTYRAGERAERARNYDLAVVEYAKAVRANPDNRTMRLALDRAKIRASQDHYFKGRRLAAAERHEEALSELQLAAELNPGAADVDAALRETRRKVRTKLAVSREGKTELQALIERSQELRPPGLDLPAGVKLPDSLLFSNASSRMVFMALGRLAGVSLVFDPGFRDAPISLDLRNLSLEEALASVTASTRTFYRVTARNTITIVPDTPPKRREYEEFIVRTFYLSNADIKEVIDLLRVVVDVRQISPITATNAIALKDTPERIAAAGRLIAAIDKARPEVVIEVELLEVDRFRLRGSVGITPADQTLQSLRNLTQANIGFSGLPSIYYRLLKNDSNTRTLANPKLRTSEGLTAQARFGEKVPVPVTQFAPLATGGVNQQPITSFQYETIGVNIDITPRTHHDDEISLALRVSVSNQSGTGFGGLPTFGNREVTTTIRLKDGETNMLAGLIRDDERTSLSGTPGLSDLPLIGRLFASHHKEARQTDIILTLTPHIVRVLDLSESDLQPLRLGREASGGGTVDLPSIQLPPRDPVDLQDPAVGTKPAFPQPLQPQLPGTVTPVIPPKKPGGGE
jgi:general secretion pathway protein D